MINAGGSVSSSVLSLVVLVPPMLPLSSWESLPSLAFSSGGEVGVACSLEKLMMSLQGLLMSLVESIEGCGLAENLSFIALGDFKEL